MKKYTQTGTRELIKQFRAHGVGLLLCAQWRDPSQWLYYAIDNGAYSAFVNDVEWSPVPFLRILEKARKHDVRPDFVVCPDIVAAGKRSLDFSMKWIEVLPSELDYYLAVQDGVEVSDVVPLIGRFKGIFVGGTKDWKFATGESWAKFCSDHDLGCHIGRVGPMDRILWAERIGATSIDSTTWVQSSRGMRHIEHSEKQQILEVI